MNYWLLIQALLPIGEEIVKAIADAQAAGKAPADIHQTVVDHTAALPAKIRQV